MPLTTVNPGLLDSQAQYTGFKNRLINGQMMIDQRNAGASLTPTNQQYSLDRWACYAGAASKYTVQQSTTAPTGFVNSIKVTSSSAYTVAAGDIFGIYQRIEGNNISDLAWGSANAKTVTLSFWVYSSLTGTFGGSLFNTDASRSYPFSYTISSANTWEQKTVTVAGDTSGTWGTSNTSFLQVCFSIGTGSTYSTTAGAWAAGTYTSATGAVSVVGTNGATFYITGVQLEKGSTATSFDYRPYGTELALCQRYCLVGNLASDTTSGNAIYLGAGTQYTATNNYGVYTLPVTMRAAPSFSVSSASHWNLQVGGSSAVCTTVGINSSNSKCPTWYVVTGTSFTTGYCGVVWANNASSMYTFSAEL